MGIEVGDGDTDDVILGLNLLGCQNVDDACEDATMEEVADAVKGVSGKASAEDPR